MKHPIKAKAFIYQSELEYISRCVLDFPNIETGGDLFGFWTHTGCPVIQYVIGPGKKANHQVGFFNQELEYLNNYGVILRRGHALQHIGQWHSHHQLGLAEPSQHDINTVSRAVSLYSLNQFFLVITNIAKRSSYINGFLFRKDNFGQFDCAGWEVLEGNSPIRQLVDTEYPELVSIPKTELPSISDLVTGEVESVATLKIDYDINSWLMDKNNHLMLKQIMDQLADIFLEVKAFVDDEDNSIFLELAHEKKKFRVNFPGDYPKEHPTIRIPHKGKHKVLEGGQLHWDQNQEIVERTVMFIRNALETKARKNSFINIFSQK